MISSSILLLLAALAASSSPSLTLAACPASKSFAVGSYTKLDWLPQANGDGLSFLTFAARPKAALNVTAVFPPATTGENPSYVAIAGSHVYMTNENAPEGALVQLSVRPAAPFLHAVSKNTGAAGTTHVAVVRGARTSGRSYRRIILTANYGGAVSSFVGAKTLYRADVWRVSESLTSAAHPRQDAPHPHMVLPFRHGSVLVPDLGSDLVFHLAVNPKTGKLSEISRAAMKPGDGPRHAVKHAKSDTVFVVNELSLTVAVLRVGGCGGGKAAPRGGKLKRCYDRDLLTAGEKKDAVDATAAAIRTTPNGRFLYVSVRYAGDVEGAIVGFRLNEKTGDIAERIGRFPSGGVHPRDFSLVNGVDVGGKCASFVAVANTFSNSVVLIRRNFGSGKLFGGVAHRVWVKTPTAVLPM